MLIFFTLTSFYFPYLLYILWQCSCIYIAWHGSTKENFHVAYFTMNMIHSLSWLQSLTLKFLTFPSPNTNDLSVNWLQWYPRDSLSAPISSAIYSCDGLLIFTGFCDGAIGIFDADSLRLRCRIAPSAYLSSIGR